MSASADALAKKKQSPAIQRRGNKPLIEKRRRARINECLLQLKNLVLKATSTELTRTGKLEKADILEMTVEYLKKLNSTPGSNMNIKEENGSNYSAGYEKCMDELVQFLDKTKGFNDEIKQKITNHCKDKLHERTQSVATAEKLENEIVSTTNSRLHDDSSDNDSDFIMDARQPSPSPTTSPNAQPGVVKEIKIETNQNESMDTSPSISPSTQHVSGSVKLVCGGDIFILVDPQASNVIQPRTAIPIVSRTTETLPVPVQQNILMSYKPTLDLGAIPSYRFCSVSNVPTVPFSPNVPLDQSVVPPSCVNGGFQVDNVNAAANVAGTEPMWRPW
ncbi:protein hairy [Patella vulgata]|uniref:protein hairy n=1 Tax=Patella vulgata TaxID=6465 RepID=UPI00217F8E4B|nr:protein hairy [Patella vulgata]